MTRSTHNWQCRPFNFDMLHIHRRHYRADNLWGFPELLPQQFTVPDNVQLFSYLAKNIGENAIAHFYLDDYRFETLWNNPDNAMIKLHRFNMLLTPDFSLYTDWPLIVQQWNHYRKQWLGRYWQEHGFNVIPTINWSDNNSLHWCFVGVKTQQVISVSVPDLRKSDIRDNFMTGYQAMLKALQPIKILVYGSLPDELRTPQTMCYQPDWYRLRQFNR